MKNTTFKLKATASTSADSLKTIYIVECVSNDADVDNDVEMVDKTDTEDGNCKINIVNTSKTIAGKENRKPKTKPKHQKHTAKLDTTNITVVIGLAAAIGAGYSCFAHKKNKRKK